MPGRPGTAARSVTLVAAPGVSPAAAKHPPDGSRADAIAEADELALDAAVSPRRILPGQSPDEIADLLRDGQASGGVQVGSFLLDQTPVPARSSWSSTRSPPRAPEAA
jgi:hypothetical protein